MEIYTNGCLDKFEKLIGNNVAAVGGVGVGIALIQVGNNYLIINIRVLLNCYVQFQFIGIVFACLLARTIRKEYQTV